MKTGDMEIEVEGDKKFVIDHFSKMNKLLKGGKMATLKMDKPGRKKRGRKPGRKKKVIPKPKKVKLDLKNMSVSEIMDKFEAKRDQDKILVFSYALNKMKKKREFRGSDVVGMFNEMNMEAPNNITYHLRKLSGEKGLLKAGRKNGRYKISDEGIKKLSIRYE
ncbi:MAG: hypothetical protein KAH57_09665 [Thermoplasmata archaeon]|nr:hypothetical protein [Thermoplasmata archaeon]